MKTVISMMFALVALLFLGSFANASSAGNFASHLNSTGQFYHAPGVGAEVIYRSSGKATVREAKRSWMNSAPHRHLLQTGQIHHVKCRGGVCVGRGSSRTRSRTR